MYPRYLLSMVPVLIVGILFREEVESLFSGNLVLVGGALMVTALLLISTQLVKPGKKEDSLSGCLPYGHRPSPATIPGISRSGATISTGLLIKKRAQ